LPYNFLLEGIGVALATLATPGYTSRVKHEYKEYLTGHQKEAL